MDRRQFLTRSGAGVAAVAAGGAMGGVGAGMWEQRQERDRREAQDYAGDGHGAQRVWWSLDTDEQVAALTFDDGPHPELTQRVLAVLAGQHVPATFFMIGQNAVEHPGLAAEVVAAGHEIGNHSWSHGRVVDQDRVTLRDEIRRGAQSLGAVTGRRTKWFRPPRGMVSGDVLFEAAVARHAVVLWSMTRGGPSVRGSAAILAHLVQRLHPGAIVDLHDGTGSHQDDAKLLRRRHEELAMLPDFLTRSLAAGYRFVTLSELLHRPTGSAAAPSTRSLLVHPQPAVPGD